MVYDLIRDSTKPGILQWWPTTPQSSTKWTTTSHLKSLNINKIYAMLPWKSSSWFGNHK